MGPTSEGRHALGSLRPIPAGCSRGVQGEGLPVWITGRGVPHWVRDRVAARAALQRIWQLRDYLTRHKAWNSAIAETFGRPFVTLVHRLEITPVLNCRALDP